LSEQMEEFMDMVYIGIAVGFFGLTWGLARVCSGVGCGR